ncbi:hypothetical protein KHA80_01320 [Anaerobacillus sp. HL2]|nr:hypothetical protein KHA80_01320 [Anaerobacillus sp. HL2]
MVITEGEEYLRKVLAINPANFESAKMLLNLLKKEERFHELEELITYLKNQGEEDPLFDWFLATTKRELDEFDEAFVIYENCSIAFSHDSDF